MSVVTVIAKVVVRPESLEQARAELLKLVEPTRREAGCIEYRLHQDNDDPTVFMFYENWESKSHLEQHMNTEHFREYIAAVEGMVVDKAVHKLTCIG